MIWHNRNWRGRRRKQSSTTTTSERKTRMKEKERERERERGRKRWRMKGARMTRVMKSQTKEERDDVWVFLLFLVASRFHLLYRMIRREIRLDIFFFKEDGSSRPKRNEKGDVKVAFSEFSSTASCWDKQEKQKSVAPELEKKSMAVIVTPCVQLRPFRERSVGRWEMGKISSGDEPWRPTP